MISAYEYSIFPDLGVVIQDCCQYLNGRLKLLVDDYYSTNFSDNVCL